MEMLRKGWLDQQLKEVAQEVQNWPAWMKREARRDYSSEPAENSENQIQAASQDAAAENHE